MDADSLGSADIARRDEELRQDLDGDLLDALAMVARRTVELVQTGSQPVYRGDMLLFRASGGWIGPALPDAWRTYVDGDITVRSVDGEHVRMMRPEHLSEIGPVIAERIGAAYRTGDDTLTGDNTLTGSGAPARPEPEPV